MKHGKVEYRLINIQSTYCRGLDENGKVLWYSVPDYENNVDSVDVHGTIYSKACQGIGHFDAGTCSECRNLLRLKSFQMRVKRSTSKTSTYGTSADRTEKVRTGKTNNRYLSSAAKKDKLDRLRKNLRRQRLVIVRLSSRLARTRCAREKIRDKLRQNLDRGDISAICKQLQRCYDSGKITGTENIIKFIRNICDNLSRTSQGRRYTEYTKNLFEAIGIIGGMRTARFLSQNLLGPSRNTVKRNKQQYAYRCTPSAFSGPGLDNTFQHLARLYTKLKSTKGITGNVLVQTAEDETVIIKAPQWDRNTDEGWGWCGRETQDHECDPSFVLKVGDNEHAYETLVDAFKNNRIGGYARVIMINPLVDELPALVASLSVTCNRFTHVNVKQQQREIQDLYNIHLLPVLGPLVGNASDGDSRRRKLHLEYSFATEPGEDRYKIDCDNFTHGGRMKHIDGHTYVEHLADQDYIHNGKKLINHLNHAGRMLTIGDYMVHMNHIHILLSRFDATQHRLTMRDVLRDDRQNWESAQKLLFPHVRELLQKVESGESEPQEPVAGTIIFLEMCWKFVEMYYSRSASLLQRVAYASYVTNFLRIWRLWVTRTGHLSLKLNFVSRETYQDITIGCHHIVNFIRASRDYAPSQPVRLNLTGSDCCEEYFSYNGSFILNKHNYTITDMYRNITSMNRLNAIIADEAGPTLTKKHRKGENIWGKGNAAANPPPDLRDFPTDDQIIESWQNGLLEAQASLRGIGVKPGTEEDDNEWFFHPERIAASREEELANQMAVDEIENDYPEADAPVLDEFGADLREAADELEAGLEDVNQIDDGGSKVVNTLNVPGVGRVHKSTLFSLLSSKADCDLSKDRLKRVKARSSSEINVNAVIEAEIGVDEIGLYDDVAIYIKDRGQNPTYIIGRVHRIQNRENRAVEYHNSVTIDSFPKAVIIVCCYASSAESDVLYEYGNGMKEFYLSNVIQKVRMIRRDDDVNMFQIHADDKDSVRTFVDDVRTRPKPNQKKAPSVTAG